MTTQKTLTPLASNDLAERFAALKRERPDWTGQPKTPQERTERLEQLDAWLHKLSDHAQTLLCQSDAIRTDLRNQVQR